MSAWFGDTDPLCGAWVPVPVEVVDHILASQPAVWPRWAAALDLRRAQDRVLGHLASGRLVAFPSRRQLAARWGWTDASARGLMQCEAEWADPKEDKAAAWAKHPASAAALRSRRDERAQPSPSDSPAIAQESPSDSPARTVEADTSCCSSPSDRPAVAQESPSDRPAVATGAVFTVHRPPSTVRSNSPQPPAERGASDPKLVEAIVDLLLSQGPMARAVEAKQMQRLLDRDAATAERVRAALKKRGALAAGVRSAAVADACPEAARLWAGRRTWRPVDDEAPAPAEPTYDAAAQQAVLDEVERTIQQRRAEAKGTAGPADDEDGGDDAADEPPPPAWVEELGAELAEAWANTRPPVGDQLRAGHGPALIELRKGLYAKGRLAIGSAPLPLLERAVRRAFELVDARQAAAVEVAA